VAYILDERLILGVAACGQQQRGIGGGVLRHEFLDGFEFTRIDDDGGVLREARELILSGG